MDRSEQKVFNPDDAFFVIDSDHLPDVQSALYGFTFAKDRTIVDSLAGLRGEAPGQDGAYVYISREDGRITVTQDFIGCYGLYLFRSKDYFAISNSFQYLVDHVKQSWPLNINWEYADYLLAADLCASVYGETMISEITMLDRCAVVEIDIAQKQFMLRYMDYRENTVDPASPEGLAILDAWQEKWADRIRYIYQAYGNIRTDISGGFDSRETMALFLSSGIDLNQILIFSKDDTLHTHKEDFEIASQIAAHYGFFLNNHQNLVSDPVPFDTRDIWAVSFYTKLGFHRQLFFKNSRHNLRQFMFTGNGGENIRDYWREDEEAYIEKALKRCDAFALSPEICGRLKASTRNVISRTFAAMRQRFAEAGRPLADSELTRVLYRETRCRNHFGKGIVEGWLANIVTLSPLMDPDLYRLRLSSEQCSDRNVLSALILDRYAPDLLSFPFEGGRSIDPATVSFVRTVDTRFPHSGTPAVSLTCGREEIRKDTSRPQSEQEKPDAVLKKAFRSPEIRKLFISSYDEKTYNIIVNDVEHRKYQPLTLAFIVLAITKLKLDTSPAADHDKPFVDYLAELADKYVPEPAPSLTPPRPLWRRAASRVKRLLLRLLKHR